MELKLRQIAFSDMLILNKVDLVTPEEIERIKAWLDDRFHRIRLVEASRGNVPLEILLAAGRFDPSRLDGAAPDVQVDRPTDCGDRHAGHPVGGHGQDHTKVFRTWSYEADEPLSLEALRGSAGKLPASIYRCKGVVHTVEEPGRQTILQVVGKRVDIAVGHAMGWARTADQDRRYRRRRWNRGNRASRSVRRMSSADVKLNHAADQPVRAMGL